MLRQIGEHRNEQKSFVLFATASWIGEGFDPPRLDTGVGDAAFVQRTAGVIRRSTSSAA